MSVEDSGESSSLKSNEVPEANVLGQIRGGMPQDPLGDLLTGVELSKTRAALQTQGKFMLEMLTAFEARLQERLNVAEARIAALRARRTNSGVAPSQNNGRIS